MGMLVGGEWVEDDRALVSAKGEFVRHRSSFRSRIGDADFTPEAGRYHLFTGPSCPWAHRTVIARELKGLTGVITLSQADRPRRQGWCFSQGIDDLQAVDGRFDLHRLYAAADPEYTGRVTVPVLWDRKTRTIVNNESSEILRMFNDAFAGMVGPTLDLYPEERRERIDAVNADVYENVNNGVYRCGFATSQSAYEEAFGRLFSALDRLERLLEGSRYLAGDSITEADVRLFPTLVRFDSVYHTLFKCNLRRIVDYRNLHGYLLDLFQTRGFGSTVDMDLIKHGYYVEGGRRLNPYGIVPLGPEIDFHAPHDRARLSSSSGRTS